jgi:hypothetical protein
MRHKRRVGVNVLLYQTRISASLVGEPEILGPEEIPE